MDEDYKKQLKKIGYEKARAEESERIRKLEDKIEKLKSRKTKTPSSSRFRKTKIKNPKRKSLSTRFVEGLSRERIRQLQVSRDIRRPLLSSGRRTRRIIIQRTTPRPRPKFIPIGWESHFVSPRLEKEINFIGGVETNSTVGQVERESNNTSRLSDFFPVRNVERETFSNSKSVDFFPSLFLEKEVRGFSNILG